MKKFNEKIGVTVLSVLTVFAIGEVAMTFAATTPASDATSTYSILSSTYTNTIPGATINGNIGFTTGPAVVPGGVHINYGSVAPYALAGTNQGTMLSALALQPCTYTFAGGAVDLATDIGHGTIGIYTPGVYCTSAASAAIIGTAGIILDGPGTYIFRIDGALDTVVNSSVTLSGASSCNVFWTPTGATTLGADSAFAGTVIDAADITVGSNATWNGRALAFGGTVTTAVGVTITAPMCGVSPATLHIIKQVINTGGGTATPSEFMLSVQNTSSGVFFSASGAPSPGTPYVLTGATYVISESTHVLYSQSFTGDCSSTGSITLLDNQDKTCTIVNTYIPPILPIPPISSGGGGGGSLSVDRCPDGDTSYSYYDGICRIVNTVLINTGVINTGVINTGVINTGSVIISSPIPLMPKTVPIIVYERVLATPVPVIASVPVIPRLPDTGISPYETRTLEILYILLGICMFGATVITVLHIP